MLKKAEKVNEFGVCYMFANYVSCVVTSYTRDVDVNYRLNWEMIDVMRHAREVWMQSSAVPSTKYCQYPVIHPYLNPVQAYTKLPLWEGEYGENRQQYLEYLSDYLEEAWK